MTTLRKILTHLLKQRKPAAPAGRAILVSSGGYTWAMVV